MYRLKPSLLIILISSCINVFSQYNDIDLSKYKLPELDRRTLETNYNISGLNSSLDGDRYNRYSTQFDLNYNRFQNTRIYQKETDLRFNFDFITFNNKENGNLQAKRNYLTPNLYYNGKYRHYNDRLFFFETDLILGSQYIHSSYFSMPENGNLNKSITNTLDLISFVPFKFGKGRIEPIQDFRQAIYIIEELTKIGKITHGKSEEQIVEFAQLISKLKNDRFFDSRLRRIAEITSLDSFLISDGFVSTQDVEYFTTLNDYWVYGNRPIRNAGTRVSGVVRPGYYYPGLFDDISVSNNNTLKYINSLLMLDGGIEVKHEKPINLYWQNTMDLNLFMGIFEGRYRDLFDTEEYKVRTPNFNVSYSQNIGYYPNTRTDINFGYSVKYFHMFENDLSNDFNAVRVATNLSLNYYISPKLRLNAFSSFYFYWQDSDPLTINLNEVNNEFLLKHFDFGLGGYNITLINELYHGFQISLLYSIF